MAWSVSSLPNTAIQPTPPGFEPWTLALTAAALYRLRQSDNLPGGVAKRSRDDQVSVHADRTKVEYGGGAEHHIEGRP